MFPVNSGRWRKVLENKRENKSDIHDFCPSCRRTAVTVGHEKMVCGTCGFTEHRRRDGEGKQRGGVGGRAGKIGTNGPSEHVALVF